MVDAVTTSGSSPPYTAREEVNINLMGDEVGRLAWRAASSMERIESTLICEDRSGSLWESSAGSFCPDEKRKHKLSWTFTIRRQDGEETETYLNAQVKIVLRTSAHNSVETIDGIWYAKFGVEKRENLIFIRKIGLARDAMFRCLRRPRLDNVAEYQVDVGRLRV